MDYTKEQLDYIWSKGIVVNGYDSNIIRKDACGAWILRSSYKEEESDYGWEVDHIVPKSLLSEMGKDDVIINNMDNLRPMNWRNNRSKSKDYPNYKAITVADGDRNVDCEKYFTVNSDVQAILANLYGL